MCDKGQKWDMLTLKCVPDSSASTASSGSDSEDKGSPVLSSILGNLPGILTGAGNFLSAAKGNPANVTNVYGDTRTNPSISWVAVGAVVAIVAVLIFVLKSPNK